MKGERGEGSEERERQLKAECSSRCIRGLPMTTFTLRGTCWPKSLELSNKGGLRELVTRGREGVLHGSAKMWTPGCVNAAGKPRQKWLAKAVTKFTKPGARLLSGPFRSLCQSPILDSGWGSKTGCTL